MPSTFPCSPVIRECSWKKTKIEKESKNKRLHGWWRLLWRMVIMIMMMIIIVIIIIVIISYYHHQHQRQHHHYHDNYRHVFIIVFIIISNRIAIVLSQYHNSHCTKNEVILNRKLHILSSVTREYMKIVILIILRRFLDYI